MIMSDEARIYFVGSLLGPLHPVLDIDRTGKVRVWIAPPIARAWLDHDRRYMGRRT